MASPSIDWNRTNASEDVESSNGTRYRVSTYGPPRESDREPVLVLVAGCGGNSYEYPALIRELSPHVRVLIYDRPGLGKSPPSKACTYESAVASINDVLQATKIRPPYILMGHSWGGMLSVAFTQKYLSNGELRGLVCLDAGAPTSSGQYEGFATDPGTPWYSRPGSEHVLFRN